MSVWYVGQLEAAPQSLGLINQQVNIRYIYGSIECITARI